MVGNSPHYNIEFEVSDRDHAMRLVRDELRSMGVGADTEILVDAEWRYLVNDDDWTPLEPRAYPSDDSDHMANPAAMSKDEFVGFIKDLKQQAKREAGGSNDPDLGRCHPIEEFYRVTKGSRPRRTGDLL
jgi:hypothetical protein